MYNLQEHQAIGFKTKNEIIKWLEAHKIRYSAIIPTPENEVFPYLVAAREVNISHEKMPYLPVGFASVSGNFTVKHCGLLSLRGMPPKVEGYVALEDNKLETLEFCSMVVGGAFFDVSRNQLKNLDFFPTHFNQSVNLTKNNITHLTLPQDNYRSVDIKGNQLVDISKAPSDIISELNLSWNPLPSTAILDIPTHTGEGYIFFPNNKDIVGIEHLDFSASTGEYIVAIKDLPLIQEKIRLEQSIQASTEDSKPTIKI